MAVLFPLLGQHLITALAESMFGYMTTSWYMLWILYSWGAACIKWKHFTLLQNTCIFFFFLRELGRQRSTIELDTPVVKAAQVQALEEAVNEKIRAHVPVNVKLLYNDSPELEKVHVIAHLNIHYIRLKILIQVLQILIKIAVYWLNFCRCQWVLIRVVCTTQVRSRGLPDDHAWPIRIVDIEGVDANMCCGTHVSNLSHLQVPKNTLFPPFMLRKIQCLT